MIVTECIHDIYPAEACSICNGNDAKRKKEDEEVTATFPAKFSGVCRSCGGIIEPGDFIGRLASGKYACGECVSGRIGR